MYIYCIYIWLNEVYTLHILFWNGTFQPKTNVNWESILVPSFVSFETKLFNIHPHPIKNIQKFQMDFLNTYWNYNAFHPHLSEMFRKLIRHNMWSHTYKNKWQKHWCIFIKLACLIKDINAQFHLYQRWNKKFNCIKQITSVQSIKWKVDLIKQF